MHAASQLVQHMAAPVKPEALLIPVCWRSTHSDLLPRSSATAQQYNDLADILSDICGLALVLPCSCEMVLVLLERKQTSAGSPYALVKQAGDSVLGVRTQCFAADKAGVGINARPPRGRLQYCANIAMKINAKMGGVNVKLVDNTQQVGADSLVVWSYLLQPVKWNQLSAIRR